MGRWKLSGSGPVYDPLDFGVDQVAPPPGSTQVNTGPAPSNQQQGQASAPAATPAYNAPAPPPAPTTIATPPPNYNTSPNNLAGTDYVYDWGQGPVYQNPVQDSPQTGPHVPPPTASAIDPRAGISSAYQKYLGRTPSEADYMSWTGNPNYEAGISTSPEAQAFAAGKTYTRPYTDMAGFVTSKLNDPSAMSDKYQWGRAVQEHPDWLQAGNLQQLVDYYNTKSGDKARVIDNDEIDFGPGIGIIDVIQGANSGNPTAYWGVTGKNGDGTTSAAPTAAPGATPGGGGAPGAGGAGKNKALLDEILARLSRTGSAGNATGSGSSSSFNASFSGVPFTPELNNLYNTLLERSRQSLDIDPNDPRIAAQVNAYAAERERANRKQLNALAERGGPNANLNSESRMLSEDASQGAGSLRAQLVGQELTSRRTEIQNALTQMGDILTNEQRIALQQELSQLDAAIRMYQLEQQNNQFTSNLGLEAEDRASYWDAVRSGLLG